MTGLKILHERLKGKRDKHVGWRDMYQTSENRTLTSGSTRWKIKAFK